MIKKRSAVSALGNSTPGVIPCAGPANERRRYLVTSNAIPHRPRPHTEWSLHTITICIIICHRPRTAHWWSNIRFLNEPSQSDAFFLDQVHLKTEIANIVSKPPVRWNNTYYSPSTYLMGNRYIILSSTEKNQIFMSAAPDNGNFTPGDTLCTGPANERRHLYITSSPIGPARPQGVPMPTWTVPGWRLS